MNLKSPKEQPLLRSLSLSGASLWWGGVHGRHAGGFVWLLISHDPPLTERPLEPLHPAQTNHSVQSPLTYCSSPAHFLSPVSPKSHHFSSIFLSRSHHLIWQLYRLFTRLTDNPLLFGCLVIPNAPSILSLISPLSFSLRTLTLGHPSLPLHVPVGGGVCVCVEREEGNGGQC